MVYPGGDGPNPEQLFTLGWSACGQAILVLAKKHGLDGRDARVNCTVALEKDEICFGFKAELQVNILSADRIKLRAVIDAYSRATCNNVPVTLTVV